VADGHAAGERIKDSMFWMQVNTTRFGKLRRRQLGESLNTVCRENNTPSRTSHDTILAGVASLQSGVLTGKFAGDVAALAFCRTAIHLDPNLAACLRRVGGENHGNRYALPWNNNGKPSNCATRVSEREKKLLISKEIITNFVDWRLMEGTGSSTL